MTAPAGSSLSPLEIACGLAIDGRPARRPTPLPPSPATPQRALRDAVLPALLRPPCLVSFSGGKDSSLVLATATRVAREEGLADPVPVTNRFPQAPEADETTWQEQVVGYLGLRDWQRVELTDELDVVGPYAQRMLSDHGLLWPFNVHFHLPLLDHARGGSLLTGVGGDQLFDALRAPPRRPRPRAVAHAALAVAPRTARAAVIARRRPFDAPWLLAAARRAATRAMARQLAAQPRGPLAARMAYELSLRYLRVATDSLALCAAARDVRVGHPLCAPGVWSAIARACGRRSRFAGSQQVLRGLFGGWLPDALAARSDKASFDGVFSNRHARDFARRWDRGGIPHWLVDAAALRGGWLAATPPVLSLTLMQAAWLYAQRN
jgi:hypothetical protein